ncbi:VC0807 family protein [Dactylosporangium sp. NPDC049140]|uniref:VC0807 family protein n=1 Tax=Dactylosporangium sp. NPDC049140 TaxID=3155647 RepID=UPI0033E44599
MSQPAGRRAMLTGFLLTAVFDVGLALVAFSVAERLGAGDRIAYLVSGIGPLTMMAITWIRARTLSGASAVILLFLLLSSAATLFGGADQRLLIAKDSLVTGGFGAVCLLSLLLPRPLMFYFGAKFATDGTREGMRHWSSLWQYPDFRASQYRITIVWGLGFLLEAALRIAAAYGIDDFELANTVATLLPFAFLAALIGYSIRTGMRARAAGLARARAAAESLATAPAVGTA